MKWSCVYINLTNRIALFDYSKGERKGGVFMLSQCSEEYKTAPVQFSAYM